MIRRILDWIRGDAESPDEPDDGAGCVEVWEHMTEERDE